MRDDHMLLFNSNRGVYIPQNFAEEMVRECVEGVSDEVYKTLESGPKHDFYWEAWESVLNSAILTDNGKTYTLHQDGDVWLIPNDWTEADWNEHFE